MFQASKVSIQYILSKFCLKKYAGFSVSDLTGHHFICFQLFKIWNEMPMSLSKLPKTVFKRKIKQTLFEILASEDYYIDLPVIIQKVKLNLFSS